MVPQALQSLFAKPATMAHPENNKDTFEDIRGKLEFDASKCVGCKLCSRDCPAKAIEIVKVADKQFKAIVSLDLCIFCGQCVESCNRGALTSSNEFKLADLTREDMKVEI
jgi:formate hydrogenlyase subunit 6/NADH:ubiquinone oxidoreductase subunit I